MKNRAYLCLGSNVHKEANLPAAVALLAEAGELAAVSPAFATAPVGAADQPGFLNAAVLLLTGRSPEELKGGTIADIERRLGRVRDPADKDAPRTIDIDIALWNDEIRLVLGRPVPDPDIIRMAHVAVPLASIAPDLVHPLLGWPLARIAARLQRQAPQITPCPDIVLPTGG